MSDSVDPQRSKWRKWLPRDPWAVVVGPVVVLLVGLAATSALRGGGGQPEEARLEALPSQAQNPEGKIERVKVDLPEGTFEATRLTDESKARVDVRLHNTGQRRSVLTSARFTINRFARIQPCGLGAGLVASARYDLVLPNHPRPGHVIEVPINQQLGPDEADRFAFRVRSAKYTSDDIGLTLLYELGISVVHDNQSEPLPVGRAVVALPSVPSDYRYMYFATPDGCARAPTDAQLRATTFRGARSPELEGFLRYIRSVSN